MISYVFSNSMSYVSFVKKKVGERKGVVADAGDEKTVISLKELQELSFMGQKVLLLLLFSFIIFFIIF